MTQPADGSTIVSRSDPTQGARAYRDAAGRLAQAVVRNRKATIGLVLLGLITIVALFPAQIAPYDPLAATFEMQAGPSAEHLLGTTQVGEDVFSQLVWGTQLTLLITVAVGLLVTLVAVVIGVSAAYIGGAVDGGLSLAIDIFLIIPTLPLLIVMSSYLEGSGSIAIIAVLCVTGWAFGARQLRAQGLSMRTADFLEAARARGERRAYIIAVEILPNMLSLIVACFLGVAVYTVATAAGLQFLGLGNSGEITWGTMLHFAQQNGALESGNPFWALGPGAAVAVLGTAFALLNYAFDEIASPALRATRRRRGKPAA